ncbi:hypothetical protein V8F33_011750 [Rhypophila sp. PSN 637]
MWCLLPFLFNRRRMDKGSNAQGTKSPPRVLDVVKIVAGAATTLVGRVTVMMITIGSGPEKGKYYEWYSYLNTEDPNIIGLGLMKAVLWVSVVNAIIWFILDVANFIAWWKYSKKRKGGSTNEGTSEPLAHYPVDLHTLAGGHNPGGYYTGPNSYYLPTSGQR